MTAFPELGHATTSSEAQPPAVTLTKRKPTPSSKNTKDEAGSIDWAAFAERERVKAALAAKEERLKEGFAAYRDAGGRFSEGLHKSLIARVEKLQKPGKREKSEFHAPTIAQAEDFVYRHNNPIGSQPLPPEQQITLSQEQIDAYCLLREGRLIIPKEDRQIFLDPIEGSDRSLIQQVQKMPLLKPQQVPQPLPVAA